MAEEKKYTPEQFLRAAREEIQRWKGKTVGERNANWNDKDWAFFGFVSSVLQGVAEQPEPAKDKPAAIGFKTNGKQRP